MQARSMQSQAKRFNLGRRCPSFILTLVFSTLVLSCNIFRKKSANNAAEDTSKATRDVTAQLGSIEPLRVTLDLPATKTRGNPVMILHVEGIQAFSRVECDLSGLPISDCVDGMAIPYPKNQGQYKMQVFAFKEDALVAQGTSEAFIVQSQEQMDSLIHESSSADLKDLLTLRLTSFKLKKGDQLDISGPLVVPKSESVAIEFESVHKKNCSTDLINFCRIGARSSSLWTKCDTLNSFSLSSQMLSMGTQTVEIESRCGEIVGPRLSISFDAVPDDYKPLMLADQHDPQGRHFVYPVREADCGLDDRRYECRSDPSASFVRCINANMIPAQKGSFEVRLVCQGVVGPQLVLKI